MSDVLAGKIIAPVFDVRVGLESLFVWNRKDRRQGYWAQIFKDAPHFINCHQDAVSQNSSSLSRWLCLFQVVSGAQVVGCNNTIDGSGTRQHSCIRYGVGHTFASGHHTGQKRKLCWPSSSTDTATADVFLSLRVRIRNHWFADL